MSRRCAARGRTSSASRSTSGSRTARGPWSTGSTRRSAAASGIVINPAGHSFTSIPILDALKVFRWPIVEVHISNIHRREPYYHRSYVSYAATGVIAGLGVRGYVLALDAISELLRQGEPAR